MASRLFSRIVAPTDFSVCSEEAWALAQRIAGAVGSEIVLVHVFVEPPSYGEASFPVNSAWQVIESARKWVEDWKRGRQDQPADLADRTLDEAV